MCQQCDIALVPHSRQHVGASSVLLVNGVLARPSPSTALLYATDSNLDPGAWLCILYWHLHVSSVSMLCTSALMVL
jgi:hypothetical protein